MIDRLFSLVLLFSVLVGGTLAIGSELLSHRDTSATTVAHLPRVVITGKRLLGTEMARAKTSDGTAKFFE